MAKHGNIILIEYFKIFNNFKGGLIMVKSELLTNFTEGAKKYAERLESKKNCFDRRSRTI